MKEMHSVLEAYIEINGIIKRDIECYLKNE